MYGKTFSENDSVHSHSKESIAMMDELLKSIEIALACGHRKCNSTLFRDVEPDSVRFVFQHIRESIEAYRDLCDELEDDKDEIRHEYEEKVVQFFNRFMNTDLTDETNYRARELDNRVGELVQEFEQERERSNQLEQRCSELARDKDKAIEYWKKHCEYLKHQLKENHEKYMKLREAKEQSPAYWKANFDRKCREVGELTKELEREHECSNELGNELHTVRMVANQILKEKINLRNELEQEQKKSTQLEELIKLIKADRDRYFKYLSETHYFDTDIAHMYPKTLIRENNPCNFCGNCRHYAQMGKDDGDFEGICTQHFIKRVDPDDASCEHFKPTYDTRVVIGKPEFPVCENCNHEDCSNCTLCPF